MSERCSFCGRQLSEAPLFNCERLKSLKWEAIEDNCNPTIKAVLHSLSCGELEVRSEAATVLCAQLLPHFYTDSNSVSGRQDGRCFTTEIESVVKATAERTGNLLIQQRLDDATSELQFVDHLVTSLLHCAHSSPSLTASIFFQFCCLPSLSHLLTFCRDTEQSSTCSFPSISPLLSSLFKCSYSLLKLCLEGTERLSMDHTHLSVDHTHLTTLISMLARLAEVAMTFDPSLVLLCWKFLAKFVCRAKPHLSDVTRTVQSIIEQLSVTMETKTRECVMCDGENAVVGGGGGQPFLKLLKLCRFLSTVMVKMILEFDELAMERGFCQYISQTLLNVQTTVVGNGFHGKYWKEYESHILLLREPLIQALINSTHFTHQLLDGTIVGSGKHAAWALNLCTLMKLFHSLNDSIQDDIIGELTSHVEHCHTSKLLDAVFHALHMSYVEVASPIRVGGVMCNGQPQRMDTLYEYILSHLSALILVLPVQHRSKMEYVLLRQMFSVDPHCSLMAADAFVFLSKQTTPDSILISIQQLSSLVSSLPTGHLQLTSVISRLYSLLPPSHLSHLTTSDLTPLLSNLLASNGHIDATQIHTHLLNELSTQLAAHTPNLVAMHSALEQLGDIVGGCTALSPSLSSLPHLLVTLLSSLPPSSQLASEVLAMAVHLSSLLISFLLPSLLLPLFQAIEQLLHLCPLPEPLSLALTHFLKASAHLSLPHPPRSDVLHILAAIFQALLHHRSWLVQHLALEAFKYFAENTPYAEAAEKCIPNDLSDHVINFIHQVPYGCGLVKKEQLQTLLRQHQTNKTTPTASETTPTAIEATPVDDLCDLVAAWERVTSFVQPTNKILSRLNEICSKIQTFISQHS